MLLIYTQGITLRKGSLLKRIERRNNDLKEQKVIPRKGSYEIM
jgi:hypothetical protein